LVLKQQEITLPALGLPAGQIQEIKSFLLHQQLRPQPWALRQLVLPPHLLDLITFI
jgi:hypothetical protein